jgi:hypothetical protein
MASLQSIDDSDDCVTRSSGYKDRMSKSDDSWRAKVATVVAAAGITFNFDFSKVGKTCIMVMEEHTLNFPKGYYRALGMEDVPLP